MSGPARDSGPAVGILHGVVLCAGGYGLLVAVALVVGRSALVMCLVLLVGLLHAWLTGLARRSDQAVARPTGSRSAVTRPVAGRLPG